MYIRQCMLEEERKEEMMIQTNIKFQTLSRHPELKLRQGVSRTVREKQQWRERERERGTGFIQLPFKNSGAVALGKIINRRPTLDCVTLRKRLSVHKERERDGEDEGMIDGCTSGQRRR